MSKLSGTERIQTPVSLLARLQDWEDAGAWDEFVAIYRELLRRFILKQGVEENAVEEVVQETLVRVAKAIRTFEYNPKRCRFMSWLLLLTHSRVVDYKRRQSRQPGKANVSREFLESMADPAGVELHKVWKEEWRAQLLHEAEKIVKQRNPRQWQIYDLYAKKELSVEAVRKKLNLSAAQVYLARTRVVKQLQTEVARLGMEEG